MDCSSPRTITRLLDKVSLNSSVCDKFYNCILTVYQMCFSKWAGEFLNREIFACKCGNFFVISSREANYDFQMLM